MEAYQLALHVEHCSQLNDIIIKMVKRINEQDISLQSPILLQPGAEDLDKLNPRFIQTDLKIKTNYLTYPDFGLGTGQGGDDGGNPGTDYRPTLDDIIGWDYVRTLAPGGATVITLKVKIRNSSGVAIKGFDAKIPQGL